MKPGRLQAALPCVHRWVHRPGKGGSAEAHEDPAIGSFLALLEKDIQSGRHIAALPDSLARSMLAALGKRVDLNEDIEGDVAL